MINYVNEISQKEPNKAPLGGGGKKLVGVDNEITMVILGYLDSELNPEDLFKTMQYLKFMQENKLLSHIGKYFKKDTEYELILESLKNLSNEQLHARVRNGIDGLKVRPLEAIEMHLWKTGSQIEAMIDINENGIFRNVFGDKELGRYFAARKLKAMQNFITSVCLCLPPRISRQLVTSEDRDSYVSNLCNSLLEGSLDIELRPEAFKQCKIPGAMLPHVMNSADWLSESIKDLVNDQFADVLIAYCSENETESRAFSDSAWIPFSDDPESLYCDKYNPVLYIPRNKESNIWEWRTMESEINMEVKSIVAKEHILPSDVEQRNALFNACAIERIIAYKSEHEIKDFTIQIHPEKCAGTVILPDIDKTYSILRFWKRGYSKRNEVLENPNHCHVIKVVLIDDFKDYIPIALLDFHSVVLFPIKLWMQSKFSLNVKNKNKVFMSKFGFAPIRYKEKGEMLYLSLLQAVVVFQFMKSLQEGEIEFSLGRFAAGFLMISKNNRRFVGSLIQESLADKYLSVFSTVFLRNTRLMVSPLKSRKGTELLTRHENVDNQQRIMSSFASDDLEVARPFDLKGFLDD